MQLINLTPHAISVMESDGIKTYPASGQQARVSVKNEFLFSVNGAPVERPVYSDATGIPDPQPDTLYIVSMLVRQALPDRKDLVSPDSGPSAVRNSAGQIDYVVGWLSN